VQLTNNFDGGPDGTTLTAANSGQFGNDPFDTVAKTGTNTILRYSAAQGRPTAQFAMEASTGAASGTAYEYWAASAGNQSQVWTRVYMYWTAWSPLTTQIVFYCESVAGGGPCFYVFVEASTGKLMMCNAAGSPRVKTTSGVILNSWFRVELRVQFSATTGNGELRYYEDADSDTETESVSFTGANLAASTADYYIYGYAGASSNLPTMYLSGIELNNTGFPGPAPFRPGKGVPGVLTNPIAVHTDTW
jgi:hypothetical protein